MRADMIGLLQKCMETMNGLQKQIALRLIEDPTHTIVKMNGGVYIKTPSNEIFEFGKYVKNKCNCK